MTNRYRVSLDNNHLDAVDASIVLLDIRYPEPEITYGLETVGNRHGAFVTGKKRVKAAVEVDFMIREYGTDDRNEVLQKVVKWAKNGGVLRTNDRDGQALYHAIPETLPSLSAKNWTETLTIGFCDYVYPFWEETTETTLSLSTAGQDISGSITVPGNVDETYLNVTVTASGAVSWVKIHAGDTLLHLTGLGMVADNVLVVGRDDENNITIRKQATSVLNKRTAASSDELLIPCGSAQTVRVEADGNVTAVFTARGCWI